MPSIDDALQAIRDAAQRLPAEAVALADALGRTLAEDVASDCDVPPHDKALVDGYAVRAADFQRRPSADSAPIELAVVEEVTAGAVPTVALTAGNATRIMTGAPLPAGADAVVMVEDTIWQEEGGVRGGVVRITNDTLAVKPDLNVMRRAVSIRRGQVVLRSGTALRPAEIGLLAEVGRRQARVAARPRVAVLATGNELIDAGLTPAAGQIRNSNGPMLLAWVRQRGAIAIDLGIARDDRQILAARLTEGLAADVLIVSGGVSAGLLDLVPETLTELGVRQIFHKLPVRPGRPIWFGVYDGPAAATLVFGLPGNPVGTLLGCELFVAEALARLRSTTVHEVHQVTATLQNDYQQRGNRTTYHPARLECNGPAPAVELARWHGSSDLRALADANAWAIFPPGEKLYNTGESIACRRML